jgi:hypothetical protein
MIITPALSAFVSVLGLMVVVLYIVYTIRVIFENTMRIEIFSY